MQNKLNILLTLGLFIFFVTIAIQPYAYAQVQLMPASVTNSFASNDESTHPPLRLTPNKSELIHLERNASSIIIGNPAHVDVMLESTRLVVVVPQAPGTTFMTILDDQGNTIMQRHLIVAAPKESYVRIRRSCMVGNVEDCEPTSVYYCPDMCHQIATPTMDEAISQDTISSAMDTLTTEIDKLQSE